MLLVMNIWHYRKWTGGCMSNKDMFQTVPFRLNLNHDTRIVLAGKYGYKSNGLSSRGI